MFDRHYHEVASPYPQTIHEHRAPTDESIRLAREYEEKAWERVKTSIATNLGDITVGALVFSDQRSASTLDHKLSVLVKVNGQPVEFSVDIDPLELPEATVLRVIDRLGKELAVLAWRNMNPSGLITALGQKR